MVKSRANFVMDTRNNKSVHAAKRTLGPLSPAGLECGTQRKVGCTLCLTKCSSSPTNEQPQAHSPVLLFIMMAFDR